MTRAGSRSAGCMDRLACSRAYLTFVKPGSSITPAPLPPPCPPRDETACPRGGASHVPCSKTPCPRNQKHHVPGHRKHWFSLLSTLLHPQVAEQTGSCKLHRVCKSALCKQQGHDCPARHGGFSWGGTIPCPRRPAGWTDARHLKLRSAPPWAATDAQLAGPRTGSPLQARGEAVGPAAWSRSGCPANATLSWAVTDDRLAAARGRTQASLRFHYRRQSHARRRRASASPPGT